MSRLEYTIESVLDIPLWEKMQDRLAELTGTAIICIDIKGNPVTKHSGRTEFCSIIRENPISRKRCFRCDALAGVEAVRRGRPYVYLCHCGIVDVAVPVMVGDIYLGAVMFGQVRLLNKDREKAVRLVNEISSILPQEDAARQEMLHASYLAGFAFTNNFVGYVHAIAHAVGALYHIPHGRANAVLLPAVLREYGSCIAPKLAVLADALSLGGDTVSEKAERMIAAIEAMRDSFDIPSTLPHLSLNDYTEIARRALKEANPTYPVPQIWDSEKIFSVLRRVQS